VRRPPTLPVWIVVIVGPVTFAVWWVVRKVRGDLDPEWPRFAVDDLRLIQQDAPVIFR
jgi:hypothetical protein